MRNVLFTLVGIYLICWLTILLVTFSHGMVNCPSYSDDYFKKRISRMHLMNYAINAGCYLGEEI